MSTKGKKGGGEIRHTRVFGTYFPQGYHFLENKIREAYESKKNNFGTSLSLDLSMTRA
jgi:hypothetical protein